MTKLPEIFLRNTRQTMGEQRFSRMMGAFEEEAPTSIRLNPRVAASLKPKGVCRQVPWCPTGYYLEGRPPFTFDPLFHAGCYYVQEAASMFVCHVLRSLPLSAPKTVLDLCAAPGGKSTAIRSMLPDDCLLVSNEPMAVRAQILLENITKWGAPNCIVTNNYPRDFRKAKLGFDVILCDVPCSGEGMFRKDPASIGEWSPQNVEACWQLQREIVADAWACLNPGGFLIYSTCTYNTKENEENLRWLLESYDAEPITIPTDPTWQITGSLLEDFEAPVYRFIPGITQGEGLFMAVVRKDGQGSSKSCSPSAVSARLKVLTSEQNDDGLPRVELTYQEALRYLRGEALTLPDDTHRGLVTVCYSGFPLGLAKNIGTRANNLYPKGWRIKTTHLPTETITILDKQ